MKIKEGFIKKPILDDIVVVNTNQDSEEFSGLIKLNETAAFIWDCVEQGDNIDDISKKLCSKYDVDEQTALHDAEDIINKMKEANVFVD